MWDLCVSPYCYMRKAVYEKGVEGEPYIRKPTKTTDRWLPLLVVLLGLEQLQDFNYSCCLCYFKIYIVKSRLQLICYLRASPKALAN